jgi:hypothetical protein
MSLPSYAVMFRGKPACPCQVKWIPAYEAELQRRGLLNGPIHIYQLIGGAAASAGAHTFGGAGDFLDIPGDADEAVWVARQMGADATWHRQAGWDGPGSIEHDHSVLTGCPHALKSSVAANQVTAVRAGFNGLGHLGRGGKDTGPRPLSGRTWQQGIEWAKEQDMPSPKDWDKDDWKAVDDHIFGRIINSAGDGKRQFSSLFAALYNKVVGK